MDYKLENSEKIFNGEVLEKLSDNEYRIKIQDNAVSYTHLTLPTKA